jgi:hypothetical protein
LAAKREEYVRRERGDERGTSGQRPLVRPEGEAEGARRSPSGRPISDSVPSGSILDRLGYMPSGAVISRARPERRPPPATGDLSASDDAEAPSAPATVRDTWSSSLAPASNAPPGSRVEDATTPPPQTLRDQLALSGGFYSRVVPSVESVSIPRPPRLPDIDPMDVSDALPPGSDTPPQAMRADEAQRSPRPEAVLIPPLLRRQAEEWKQTGSLSLPSTVSSRHARALQRALLLSMLQSTDYGFLPEGIAQRAAWMFREGWGEGKKQRDADDLCFVLGLSSGPSARAAVIAAASAHIPAEAVVPPSSPRWSSRPPR